MPHPRVWFVIALITFITALIILATNPATPAPGLQNPPTPYWPDVVAAFQHIESEGPRHAGQILLLFSGLFLIHACVCLAIRKRRITPRLGA